MIGYCSSGKYQDQGCRDTVLNECYIPGDVLELWQPVVGGGSGGLEPWAG